jgi:GntR family transcriptional regulator / MocR family aminotransferase
MWIRRSRRTPLGEQLYDAIRAAVLQGDLAPGTRLPSTRELADAEGVARNTALRVYARLLEEGYLVGRHGAGTFVAPALPDAALASLHADQTRRLAPRRGPRLSARGRRLAPLVPSWAAEGTPLPYDFRYGRPSFDDFPHRAWRRLLGRCLRGYSVRSMDYGAPAGLPELREAVARYVSHARAVACRPEQVVIVHGSQQALHLAAEVLLDPGDRVLVEEPGYPGATVAFHAAGATLVPGPVGPEGLDVAALGARTRGVRLVYVTPSHQFPTGVVMTLGRRLALLAWAERTGAWIFEDDYDSDFRFGTWPVESLQGLDRRGCVVYAGTFSKVLFPALRLGYLVLPEPLVAPFVAAKALADTGTAGLEQQALALFLREGHFVGHLRRARARNAARRATLLAALATHLGGRIDVLGANAGVHVMLGLRGVPVAHEPRIVARAAAAGVGVYSPAPFFLAPERRREAALLLGYASLSPEQIRRGVARLAAVIRRSVPARTAPADARRDR